MAKKKRGAYEEARDIFGRISQQAGQAVRPAFNVAQQATRNVVKNFSSTGQQGITNAQRFIENPKPVNFLPTYNVAPPARRSSVNLPAQVIKRLKPYEQPIRTAQNISEQAISGLLNFPNTIVSDPLNMRRTTVPDVGRISG